MRFKRLFNLSAPLVAGGLALAPIAQAEVTWMGGLWGTHPNYASITPLTPADKCGTTCERIAYDNWSVQSATKSFNSWWLAKGAGADTHWFYSESTDGYIKWAQTHPNDLADHIYLIGSPSTPGYTDNGYYLPAGDYSNVTFVVRQGDSVATNSGSLSTHLSGYNNLNLNNYTSKTVDPRTGAAVLYFAAPATTTPKWWMPKSTTLAAEAAEPTQGVDSHPLVTAVRSILTRRVSSPTHEATEASEPVQEVAHVATTDTSHRVTARVARRQADVPTSRLRSRTRGSATAAPSRPRHEAASRPRHTRHAVRADR